MKIFAALLTLILPLASFAQPNHYPECDLPLTKENLQQAFPDGIRIQFPDPCVKIFADQSYYSLANNSYRGPIFIDCGLTRSEASFNFHNNINLGSCTNPGAHPLEMNLKVNAVETDNESPKTSGFLSRKFSFNLTKVDGAGFTDLSGAYCRVGASAKMDGSDIAEATKLIDGATIGSLIAAFGWHGLNGVPTVQNINCNYLKPKTVDVSKAGPKESGNKAKPIKPTTPDTVKQKSKGAKSHSDSEA